MENIKFKNLIQARHDQSQTSSLWLQVAALCQLQLWLHCAHYNSGCTHKKTAEYQTQICRSELNSVRTMLRADPWSQTQLRLAAVLMFLCLLSLCSCVLLSLCCCVLLSLWSYVPVSYYPYVPVSYSPYVPVSYCPYVPVSYCPYVPVSYCHYVPVSYFAT